MATVLVFALLAGCVRTRMHGEIPALLGTDAASRTALQKAVDDAVDGSVLLGADAFTRDNVLMVEFAPAMVNGQRVDGRETRPPIRFTLLISDGKCVLVSDRGRREALRGAQCTPR
jgi:hypothetical protein